MGKGSRWINAQARFVLGEMFWGVVHEASPRDPGAVLCRFSSLPVSLPHNPCVLPGIISQIKCLHPNPCLRLCFAEAQTKMRGEVVNPHHCIQPTGSRQLTKAAGRMESDVDDAGPLPTLSSMGTWCGLSLSVFCSHLDMLSMPGLSALLGLWMV